MKVNIRGQEYTVDTVYSFDYIKLKKEMFEGGFCQRKLHSYYNRFMTFDIEATSINNVKEPFAFMYIWQVCINYKYVIMGRTWDEFVLFLDTIKSTLYLDFTRLVVYVHYLPYEFQFIRNFVEISEFFAIEMRKPVKFLVNNFFEFRCSYKLSNMNLAKFISNTPNAIFQKLDGDEFNYNKIRTPKSILEPLEYAYCYCDVRGLYEAVSHLLRSYGDTLATIPLTSTGYLRREVRKEMQKNKKNFFLIRKTALNYDLYNLCKQALRGGNAHANPMFANEVLESSDSEQIRSKDMSSAYPAEILQKKFPISPFWRDARTPEQVINSGNCFLALITFKGLRIKTFSTIPYIASAKKVSIRGGRFDNGRVLSADMIKLAVTDIDYQIIMSQYDVNDGIEVDYLFAAKYGYLPKEYRSYVFERYIKKCDLKGGDDYLYAKEKNKINGLFGMMLTDIVHDEIQYDKYTDKNPFHKELADIDEAIHDWYNGYSVFLAYQWGIWVTAHCRMRLQKAIDAIGEDVIYCDTDSVKYFGDHEDIFANLNQEILDETTACGYNTNYTRPDGRSFTLGLWEDDDNIPYKQFKTLGSKKYCYVGSDSELHITVAGLSKVKGKKYLDKHGGIEAFRIGTIVPAGDSGRTSAHYDDRSKPHVITLNGEKIITGSSIAIENVPYTFGITGEYAELLESLDKPID